MPRTVPALLRLIWAQSWVRLLAYLLLIVAVFWLARSLSSILVVGLVAYALAYLVNPLLVWLERRRIPRMVGVLVLLLVLLALLGLMFWTVISQVLNLLNGLPQLAEQFNTFVSHALDHLKGVPGINNAQARLNDFVNGLAQRISDNLAPIFQRILASGSSVLGGVASVGNWISQAAFALTLAIYFMLDYARVGPSVLRLFPRRWQAGVTTFSNDVAQSFGSYARGQIVIGLALGLLVALGLVLLGVPNALALGLLTAVLNLIPYVGLVLAAVPALLLTLPEGWLKVVLVLVLFIVANQIGGNLLSPWILGRSNNLSPAAVLLALLIGIALGGFAGALLAIPTASLLKHWTERYWIPSRAHESLEEE